MRSLPITLLLCCLTVGCSDDDETPAAVDQDTGAVVEDTMMAAETIETDSMTPETYAAYLSYVSDPATMHAMCEDYRAAASIDLDHDRADRDAGRSVSCPVRVLWGEFGTMQQCFAPLADWRRVARDVTGRSLPCGHYVPEEVPSLLIDELLEFFV